MWVQSNSLPLTMRTCTSTPSAAVGILSKSGQSPFRPLLPPYSCHVYLSHPRKLAFGLRTGGVAFLYRETSLTLPSRRRESSILYNFCPVSLPTSAAHQWHQENRALLSALDRRQSRISTGPKSSQGVRRASRKPESTKSKSAKKTLPRCIDDYSIIIHIVSMIVGVLITVGISAKVIH